MQVFFLLAILVATLAVVFALQNTTLTTVTFLAWSFQGSLALILLIALAAGAIASSMASLPALFKSHRNIVAEKRKTEELEKQVSDLQSRLKAATRDSADQTPSLLQRPDDKPLPA